MTGTGTGSIPAWESVSAGVSLSGTTDGTIATVTGANALIGETALTFDGTTLNVVGNAGVGLARTDGTLHVQTASASGGSGITPVADCDDLVIENNGVAGITIGTTDATLGKISFISPSQNNGAFIEGGHNSADPVLKFSTSNTERMRITSGGNIEVNGAAHRINAAGTYFVNDTANAKMTQGITIQQGANDNEILAFKSSDVAHGMTLNPVETDTFAHFRKAHADYGGLQLASHGEAQTSANLRLEGACGADTSDTTSSYAAVQLYGFVNNPVGVRDGMTATSNAVGFNNAGTTRVIIKGDGTVHASDTSWATALDDMPDALAGRAYTTEMADRQGEGLFGGMKVNAPELVQRMEDAGIVTHAELEGEGSIPGHRFLNVQKGIKFSWDMGFQNFSFLAEIAKVLSPEQREALPAQMQQAFAQLEENKMELN